MWDYTDNVEGLNEQLSMVTILGTEDANFVFARSDTSFLGPISDFEFRYDPRITQIRVWGGPNAGAYECERGWSGDDEVVLSDFVQVDIRRVLGEFPAPTGGTNVIWSRVDGFGRTISSVGITNSETGEMAVLGNFSSQLIDCSGRYLAIQNGEEGAVGRLHVVDLATIGGENDPAPAPGFNTTGSVAVEEISTRQLGNGVGGVQEFGFDCNGSLLLQLEDSTYRAVDLEALFFG